MAWTAGIVLSNDERWVRCFFPEAASNYDVVGVARVGKEYHAHRCSENDMYFGVVDENTGNSETGVSAHAWGYVQTDGACTMKAQGPIDSGGYVDAVLHENYGVASGDNGPTALTFAVTTAALSNVMGTVAVTLNSQIYRQHDGLIGG